MYVIVSETADKYFKENDITSEQFDFFCRKHFNPNNLKGFIVWYEGNKIGYIFR